MAEEEMVTPGEVLGKGTQVIAGRGAYLSRDNNTVYASLTGRRSLVPPSPESPDQRPTVEVIGHKSHGPVPEPGCVVIARACGVEGVLLSTLDRLAIEQKSLFNRWFYPVNDGGWACLDWLQVTKVMARMASADIMCVGSKSVREKFSGIIRQQDVRATEIDKVDMHSSFRPGDTVKASVISLGDARAYYLSTAQNELGVVSAESISGGTMVPVSWTEMQCPLTGQIEQRKVAKVGA